MKRVCLKTKLDSLFACVALCEWVRTFLAGRVGVDLDGRAGEGQGIRVPQAQGTACGGQGAGGRDGAGG